jgi:hypothetical protein
VDLPTPDIPVTRTTVMISAYSVGRRR